MKLNKKIFLPIFLVAGFFTFFCLGIWIGATKVAYYVPQPNSIDFSLFWDAYGKLQQNFINPEKIDNQKVIYGAIEGMTKSLGDPYTSFFTPEEAKRFQQEISGSFDGIGVEIGIKKNQLTVVSPIKGTPGQKAGLQSGDFIVKIGNINTIDMTTEEAVSLIRGPKGTDVILTIFRDGWDKTKDIKITRDVIEIPAIDWEIKNGDVAYIHIYQFNDSLSLNFKTIALQILQSPAKKIVLDLRDNPGGYLGISQEIAGWFLKKGQTVTIENFGKNKQAQIYRAEGNETFINYPIVILINQGSASASEILAGSLRDNRNIKLIGTKSFGKGSVQKVLDFKGGSLLKVTIAKWLTPNGVSISDVGLEPDIKVENTDDDIRQAKDPQLYKALEIINTLK
jgi:carboxyl-terminal processing protease